MQVAKRNRLDTIGHEAYLLSNALSAAGVATILVEATAEPAWRCCVMYQCRISTAFYPVLPLALFAEARTTRDCASCFTVLLFYIVTAAVRAVNQGDKLYGLFLQAFTNRVLVLLVEIFRKLEHFKQQIVRCLIYG